MPLLEGMGLRLKSERERLGLTQIELAEKIGVAKRTVINYETESNPVLLSYVHQLGALGADEHYLLFGYPRQGASPLRTDALFETLVWLEEYALDLDGKPLPLRELLPLFEMVYQDFLDECVKRDAGSDETRPARARNRRA